MNEEYLIDKIISEECHESFQILMDRHFDAVRLFIIRVVMNEHDADDIAQETFIIAFQKMHTFKKNAKISTWLCRIAYNKSCEHLRKHKKRGVELSCDFIAHETNDAHQIITNEEEYKQITDAIYALSDKLRAVIIMVIIEEKEIDEVAEIIGCPKATVYWRLHQARKELKKNISKNGGFYE